LKNRSENLTGREELDREELDTQEFLRRRCSMAGVRDCKNGCPFPRLGVHFLAALILAAQPGPPHTARHAMIGAGRTGRNEDGAGVGHGASIG